MEPLEDVAMEAAALEEERKIEEREEQSDTTSADSDTEPLGSGPRGVGAVLEVGSHNRKRQLCDGGGLCSLGLWPPAQRPLIVTPRLSKVREVLDEGLLDLDRVFPGGYRGLFNTLAEGKVQESPLHEGTMGALAESLMTLWDADGSSARVQPGDRQMAIRGCLL